MLPAPRKTTKSPGLASSRTIGAIACGPVDVAGVAMTAGADQRHQRLGIDAFDRIFAGRIDRRHHDRVGIVEAGGEIVEQVAQTREAMRLGDRDDAALAGIARGLQHRLDLDRMMAVVVEYLRRRSTSRSA